MSPTELLDLKGKPTQKQNGQWSYEMSQLSHIGEIVAVFSPNGRQRRGRQGP